jgi:RNA polymerase sigma factor for flagellar operon FliA
MNLDPNEVNRLLADIERQEFCGLDAAQNESGSENTLTQSVERRELLDLVWKAVEELPERQKLVLWLYYCEELTLKEVGAVLDVNEARASQLHSKAIAVVRTVVTRRLGVAGDQARRPNKQRAQRRAERLCHAS